ncbi:hypothetical protein EDB81DRAFT_762041 [Dactylonectria macrodidyma]|uniref:Uncharacterized protein n=1 Tax=Dactylonectria macrodidyma TaxID=307937 RepID=A0A9P9IZ82_9HYPO|nr:hypothetical protein EDB81DRAFT_762041 [Dactylonectria macrodidyma]
MRAASDNVDDKMWAEVAALVGRLMSWLTERRFTFFTRTWLKEKPRGQENWSEDNQLIREIAMVLIGGRAERGSIATETSWRSTTFLGSDGSTDELGPVSWFILAQGVIGATTSFIPVVVAATGVGPAVLGVAVGFLAVIKEPALDPQFTTFADLSARLGDVKSNTQTAMPNHFNALFRNTPLQGGLVAGQELLNLISSGAWANQDVAQLPYSKPDMVRLIESDSKQCFGIPEYAWQILFRRTAPDYCSTMFPSHMTTR